MFINEFKLTLKAMRKHIFLPYAAAITLAGVILLLRFLNGGGDYAGIKVGVVNEDENYYMGMMLDNFNDVGVFGNIISIERMTMAEAEGFMTENSLSAYFVIPENYMDTIYNGGMTPVTMVCNLQKPFETTIISLAAKSGISFIRIGQAGIFAAIDFARNNHIATSDFRDSVVVPVNMKFLGLFVNYNNFYNFHNLSLTEIASASDYYIRIFSFFFIMVSSLFFYRPYKFFFGKSITDSYMAAKIPVIKAFMCKQLSLIIILAAVYLPFLYVYGKSYFAVIFGISGLLIFTSAFFKETAGGIIFILVYALLDIYFAGGIIPLPLLPKGLSFARFFTMHNYSINIGYREAGLFVFGLAFTFAAVLKLRRRT